MDGTLLNEHHVISDNTAKAIKKLQEHGVEFMIATGRSYASAKPLLDQHGIEAKMINLNGAANYNQNGQLLDYIPIEVSSFQDILSFCDEHQLEYLIMTEHHIYVKDVQAFIDRSIIFLKKLYSDVPESDLSSDAQFIEEVNHVKAIDDFKIDEEHHPLKIMTFSKNPQVFVPFKEKFEAYEDLDITSSSLDNLEITHNAAQKGLAVEKYLLDQDFGLDQVLSIGDSLNDRSMLKMAKYGFAMDNASDEIKTITNYLAPSNRIDGVAQVIEAVINNSLETYHK